MSVNTTTKIFLGSTLLLDLSSFAPAQSLTTHTTDAVLHLTAAERDTWNAKLGPSALDGYAQQSWVTARLSSFVTTDALTGQLAGYVTTDSQTATLDSYATKNWVTQQIAAKHHIQILVVDSLPLEGMADVIYLAPKGWEHPETADDSIREQYVWIDNAWIKVGDTSVSLAGYAQETWVTTQLNNYVTAAALAGSHYTKAQTDNALAQAKNSVLQDAKTYADQQIAASDEDSLHFGTLTQAEYDALAVKDANRLYVIQG